MNILRGLKKHSSPILTGVGISLDVTCAVLTGQAMVKANRIIEAEADKLGRKLTNEEKIKLTWKLFLLPAGFGLAGAGCHIGSNIASHKKQMALVGIATASETAYSKLKNQIPEMVSPKKAKEIKEAHLNDLAKSNFPQEEEIENARNRQTPNAEAVLFFFEYPGRWIRTNTDDLIRAQNTTNERMTVHGKASLADVEYDLGVKISSLAEDLQWDLELDGLIEIGWQGAKDSFIHKDGTEEPYFIATITPEPKLGYQDISW